MIWSARMLVGAGKEGCAGGGGEVVLIDAVAGDAEAADEHAVSIERHSSGEKHDAVLILLIRWCRSPGCRDSACRIT